jgi:SUKH-3 immunity protein
MKVNFSPAVLDMLGAAGWDDTRRTDQSLLVGQLVAVGFAESQAAQAFLERFGQLHLEHDPSLVIGERLVRSSTDFDPSRVCTRRDVDVAELCSALISKALFPVGVNSFHMTIYITSDEHFYAGVDSSVYEYAEDASSLFGKIIAGVAPARIGTWS